MTARTAEVAVFAGVRGPARTFSYLVPDGLELLPGHLVRVGLGARAVPGVVISLDGAPAGRELKAIDALVHPLPLLRPHQLTLAGWIAASVLNASAPTCSPLANSRYCRSSCVPCKRSMSRRPQSSGPPSSRTENHPDR